MIPAAIVPIPSKKTLNLFIMSLSVVSVNIGASVRKMQAVCRFYIRDKILNVNEKLTELRVSSSY